MRNNGSILSFKFTSNLKRSS